MSVEKKAQYIKTNSTTRLGYIKRLRKLAGDKCKLCGYNKCSRALEFHHLDPMNKEFEVCTSNGRSYARLFAEAAKCILLCSNCHREVEEGITCLTF